MGIGSDIQEKDRFEVRNYPKNRILSLFQFVYP